MKKTGLVSLALYATAVSRVLALDPQAIDDVLNQTVARPEFDKSNDLLLAQFDSKPDADDIQAQAALGSMLAHPNLAGVNCFAVAGAIGTQGGTFIHSEGLFTMAFGAENIDWTDANSDWPASVTRIKEKVRAVLDAGGTVWVQEAGQSNMTADWVALPARLLRRISNRIINEVRGVNRVVYDISSKPPSTIEWE